ncbi:two-component system response regulator DesR [Streptomyces sp. TE12347]
MTDRIRVLLADDEHLIRGALAGLLALNEDLTVVAEAATGPEAISMARAHRPDVAVLDLRMPGNDGIEVTQTLHAELDGCRTVILTGYGEPGQLNRALRAGVRGFLPKTVTAHDLANVIRAVHAGRRYIASDVTADAIAYGDRPSAPHPT